MKIETVLLISVTVLVLLANLSPFLGHATARTSQHVVLIILDSFSPHYMAMYDLPYLRKLTNEGVWYSRAQGQNRKVQNLPICRLSSKQLF